MIKSAIVIGAGSGMLAALICALGGIEFGAATVAIGVASTCGGILSAGLGKGFYRAP